MTDRQPPEPALKPARKSLFERFSIVWLVPIGALLISLGVVWQSYAEKGPVIEILFDNASGVHANETELRYRDVTVGLVEEVRFTSDLSQVVVVVRLDKDVAPFVDDQSQFWVVRPEVSAQGVSGLDTVLAGVYIAGNWDQKITGSAERFNGSPSAPLVRNDQQGIAIQLRSSTSEGLSEGTPILYRGIKVGKIGNLRLSEDGVVVLADGFVDYPTSNLITTATRFWDTSGFSFSFGAQGAQLDVSSLASLVSGGISFDTTISGGEAVEPGRVFQLYDDEDTARSSVFSEGDGGPALDLTVIFEDAVSGLETGAIVEFRGITVGKVSALTGIVDQERFGDRRVRLLATLEIQPGKMGLGTETSQQEALDYLANEVENGLRAQLQNASILGGLRVSLIEVEDALEAEVDYDAKPYPLLPSTPADLSDFADTAEGVFNRVNALPIEELLGSAINVMDSVNRLLNDPALTDTPEEVRGLLSDVRGLVTSDGVRQVPENASAALASVNDAVRGFEDLIQSVRDAGTVDALVAALSAAQEAADAVVISVEGVPDVLVGIDEAVASLDSFVQSAEALPLETLVTEASTILTTVEALVAGEGVQSLPGALNDALAEAQGLVADIRTSGMIDSASQTIATAEASVRQISEALQPVLAQAQQAATDVSGAIAGVPAIVEQAQSVTAQIDTLLSTVNAMPLDAVVTQVGEVLSSTQALVSAPATQQLPADLGQALNEAQGLVAEIRESGMIDSASATIATAESSVRQIAEALQPVLEQARQAATDVSGAISGVPAIVEQARSVTAQIDTLLSTVNAMPLEEVVTQAGGVLASAQALVSAPATQQLPADLGQVLNEAEGLVAEIRASGMIDSASATIATAESSVRQIAEALQPVLAQAEQAAADVSSAIAGVPTIIEDAQAISAQIDTLLTNVNALPFDAVMARASAVLGSAEALVSAPATQQLPADLSLALNDLRGILGEVTESGLIGTAEQTLATTQGAVRDLAQSLEPVLLEAQKAATAIATASENVPDVVARADAIAVEIEALVAEARSLPLEELTTRVSELMATAEVLIGSEDTRQVPAALNAALGQVNSLLAEVQEAGLIANANTTLTAASGAANALARDLPALSLRLNSVLGEATTVLGGYRADGTLGSEARSALRDIREAAKSFNSLARMLERNPNSLLLGR